MGPNGNDPQAGILPLLAVKCGRQIGVVAAPGAAP